MIPNYLHHLKATSSDSVFLNLSTLLLLLLLLMDITMTIILTEQKVCQEREAPP